jgi:pimeloyl-ACP methyl ester carboxylesterase
MTTPSRPVLDGLHLVEDLGSLDPAWAGIRTTHHEVEGARVRVLTAGEHTERPPLVLVHGLGGAATNWVEVQPALATDRLVLAVDLPGHGETAPPRPTTPRPAAAARFLGRLLRQLDLGPVVLVGNSMGGLVATLLAGEEPSLVAGLVLVAPALPQAVGRPQVSLGAVRNFAPFVVPAVGRSVRRRRARRLSPAQRYRMTVELVMAHPDDLPARLVALGEANVARGDELPWRLDAFQTATSGLFELTTLGGKERTLAAMAAIDVPTFLLWGDRDQLVHANVVATVRARRPDWPVVVLPDVGHVPQIEVPGRVVELIRDHLVAVDHVAARPV